MLPFIDEIQKEIKQGGQSEDTSSALPLPKDSSTIIVAEKYFQPFELACQSRSPKIVITALDCLQVKYKCFLNATINKICTNIIIFDFFLTRN